MLDTSTTIPTAAERVELVEALKGYDANQLRSIYRQALAELKRSTGFSAELYRFYLGAITEAGKAVAQTERDALTTKNVLADPAKAFATEYPTFGQNTKFCIEHDTYEPCSHSTPAIEAAPVVAARTPVTEDGMYRLDGTIYKVQTSPNSGHRYAKVLVVSGEGHDADVSFEYAKGMIRKLAAQDRMTIEEAKEFGALYGTCCVCGRTLTNETSIEAGIGPVCGGRI